MGHRIAIDEILKYNTLDFPTGFAGYDQNQANQRAQLFRFRIYLSDSGIDTQHWHDLDQEMIATIQTSYLSIMIWFREIRFKFRFQLHQI